MTDAQGSMSGFAELIILPDDDVSGSWNRFMKRFAIIIGWKTVVEGT